MTGSRAQADWSPGPTGRAPTPRQTWWGSGSRPPTEASERIVASYEVGSSHVVVDTRTWLFGNKVMLPAGTLDRVDGAARRVYVARTKERDQEGARFDDDTSYIDRNSRDRLGEYYSRFSY